MVHQINNAKKINLPLSVWLVNDNYSSSGNSDQKIPEGEIISATTLLKPIRQLVLSKRLKEEDISYDVTDYIASSMGKALHDSIEQSWTNNYKINLKKLGYSEEFIEKIIINPKLNSDFSDKIPIFLEKRFFKKLGKYVISGQIDMILDYALHDFKSTSTYSFTSGSKDEDYILQGSIYRWLIPNLIINDELTINFIFTDWNKHRALTLENYPQNRVESKVFKLLSLEDTEKFISDKLKILNENLHLDEKDILPCSSKELWREPSKYKYYSDPSKIGIIGTRANKVFDSQKEANDYLLQKKIGKIVEFEGKIRACSYCPVFNICSQKDKYLNEGLI